MMRRVPCRSCAARRDPDQADAKSVDLIARESVRLTCVLAFVPQTSLDPQQMREWIPNNDYRHHAFVLPSMADFIAKRAALTPWIQRFSPYELATADDPPVYLFYDSVPAFGQPHKAPRTPRTSVPVSPRS